MNLISYLMMIYLFKIGVDNIMFYINDKVKNEFSDDYYFDDKEYVEEIIEWESNIILLNTKC